MINEIEASEIEANEIEASEFFTITLPDTIFTVISNEFFCTYVVLF